MNLIGKVYALDIDDIENPTGFSDLSKFIVDALNLAIGAAAVICVAIMIGAGYMYITAAGDETKVEKATKTLTFAIVGLAICFISVLLVNFVLDELLDANTDNPTTLGGGITNILMS
jgi:TRAP-type C4-dicarboxylate transport system permease small subunit